MIVQKMVTQKDIAKLEEVYKEAHQRCAAYHLPHTFKAGQHEIKMCWEGRINRAQGLVINNPNNEIIQKAYDELCKTADAFLGNAHKAREWYQSECQRLNQPAKKLPQDGDCTCDYCQKVKIHLGWLKAEIEYGAAIHDLVCGPATVDGDKITYGTPAILDNLEKGKELFDKLIKAMSDYKDACSQQGQAPDWIGAAYGWKRSR